MHLLWVIGLIIVWVGLSGQAMADQTDPRLDALFARLKAASTLEQALPAEKKIWEIWLETPNKEAARWLRAGLNHLSGGAQDEALAAFDDVVMHAPDFAEGWNKRATLHFQLGNYAQSLSDIDKTLQLEPRHFGALSGRGLVYLKLDNLEGSLAAFEAALALYPHMPGARNNVMLIRQVIKQREI